MTTFRLDMHGLLRAVSALFVSLAVVGAAGTAVPLAGAQTAPDTGNWAHQAPYPTRFAVNGVDMVTPTEGWAVAYTDILHTTDGGATWENQPRPGGDNLYSVDFFDTEHGIAMGNTTLYTTNGGQMWLENTVAFGYDVEMADANNAYIVDHRSPGYYRTTNGGAIWAWRAMPSNINGVQCFDPLNCVATSPTGVYHTTDGGANWSFTSGNGATYTRTTYFVNHNWGWIVTEDRAERTTDGGATWQTQTLPGGSWVYAVSFADQNNGWGVGANIVRTTNGGATWVNVPATEDLLPLWDVDSADAQHVLAGGDAFINTDSVLITSSDGGASWVNRTNGTINSVSDLTAVDHTHAWASHSYGGKITRTTDAGRTWSVFEIGEQYALLEGIDMADLQYGWTVGFHNTFYNGYIYRTTDGGATWFQQFDFGSDVLRKVAALDPQTAIFVGGYNATGSLERRTTDGGNSWHNMNLPINDFFADVFFLTNSTGWMASAGGHIIKTTDGGDTWVQQPAAAEYGLTSIHFSDTNNGWAGGYYGTLLRTTNGGASWTPQDPQIPEYTHVLAVNSTSPTRGWIAGYGGGAQSRPYVKYTTDGGTSWNEHTPSVGPYDSFSALAFLEDEYGWAGGAAGAFLHTPAGFVTPTPTATGQATGTRTVTRTPTPTNTGTFTRTPAPPTLSRTTTPTRTFTPTQPTATNTPTGSITPVPPTLTRTNTPVPPSVTSVPSGTPGPCTISFSDVQPTEYFYEAVRYLYCAGVISGYSDNTFRPYNNTTRGQLSKIVVLAQGWQIYTPPQPTFSDVPTTHTFYQHIETAYQHGVISGYADGTFRPGSDVTRGQLTKIVVLSEGWTPINPPQPTFTDVPSGSPFYGYIESAYSRGIISGYSDGTFRPGNSATRGQIAKIVHSALGSP